MIGGQIFLLGRRQYFIVCRQNKIKQGKMIINLQYSQLLMLQLLFTVRATTAPGEIIKVVGSIKDLGQWNIQNSLTLTFNNNVWEGAISNAPPDTKIQFKLIKIKANGALQWEVLPNNANRKFKPKFSTQFHLQWSKPAGKVNSISRFSYKLKGMPAVIIKKRKEEQSDYRKQSQEFDPYSKAHDQDSGESDEEQFLLVRRKMSDQININSSDLEEIYYKNSPLQIFSGLLKKIKVYVITKELEQTQALHSYIEQELCKLPGNYLPRWITQDCFNKQKFNQIYSKMKKKLSLFQIRTEELQLQTLYSRTSYFILLQIDVALSLGEKLQKVPCCLFLPSEKYKQAISHLPQMQYIDLICFDSAQTNKAFYQHLRGKQSQFQGSESEAYIGNQQVPSVQFLINELQRLRQKDILVTTLSSIPQKNCLFSLSQPNTISIIDVQVINQNPQFAKKFFQGIGQKSMQLIVSEKQLPKIASQFKQQKNILFIYDNFQKVILEGKQYTPLRSFRQVIEQIKLRSKLYKQSLGGEITQRQNSIIYIVPQNKMQIAVKVQTQCRNVVKKFSFVKVSRKGARVKISWNVSKQIRLIRTLCQIKLLNYGQLGDFNMISKTLNFKELRQDIKLLIQHNPKFFIQNDPKITYYCYGDSKKPYLSIVPECINSFM